MSIHLQGIVEGYRILENIQSNKRVRVTEVNSKYINNIRVFEKYYPKTDDVASSKLIYTYFDDIDSDKAIPILSKLFLGYVTEMSDLSVRKTQLELWNGRPRENVTGDDMLYVYEYLKDPRFLSVHLLKTRKRDHIVHAVTAFVLQWPVMKIEEFGKTFNGISEFTDRIIECVNAKLIVSYKGYPVLLHIFKILMAHLRRDMIDDGVTVPEMSKIPKPYFSLQRYVSKNLLLHFQEVYRHLQAECWGPNDSHLKTAIQVENTFGVPFAQFTNRATTAEERKNRPKYITGVACCGKTTVLDTLRQYGWTIKSRGDLGTFGGKSKSPAHVAALHAALDHAYRAGATHIIGDRGPIDNPLWSAIMELCNPLYADTMVNKLMVFFEKTFNELVIRYHAGFDVVVFLDPYPSRNRERMLCRCENGDALRGRLQQYVSAQFMAYYMFASLFGFETVYVPYTSDGVLDTCGLFQISKKLLNYYGVVDRNDTKPYTHSIGNISKMEAEIPDFMQNYTFSIFNCIYK